jgi:adenylate kinase family enzyme
MIILIMGVSGSGKTTIGEQLAADSAGCSLTPTLPPARQH